MKTLDKARLKQLKKIKSNKQTKLKKKKQLNTEPNNQPLIHRTAYSAWNSAIRDIIGHISGNTNNLKKLKRLNTPTKKQHANNIKTEKVHDKVFLKVL